MLSKIYKITLILCLATFHQNISYSKSFNEKNVYNYFSALVSYENGDNELAIKYFGSTKTILKDYPLKLIMPFSKNWYSKNCINKTTLCSLYRIKWITPKARDTS